MRTVAARTALACGVLLACGAAEAGTAAAAAAGTAAGGVSAADRADAAVAAHAERPTGTVASWQPPVPAFGIDGANGSLGPDQGEVSCAGPSYCALVGDYAPDPQSTDITAWIWDRTDGFWDSARQIPGLAALNKGHSAGVNTVSCGGAGNCVAGGWYTAAPGGSSDAFVVSELNGVWQRARPVGGLPGSGDQGSEVDQVSCAAPGECTATGRYFDGDEGGAFAVDEADGLWSMPQALPSIDAIGGTTIESLSCPSPGNCAAAGDDDYSYASNSPAFVIDEVNGRWGSATRVRGMTTNSAYLPSVSCSSAGNCVAVGTYTSGRYPDGTAMEVTETDGHWGSSHTLPGVGASSVSCPADGDCTVLTSGDTTETSPNGTVPASGYIVDEVDGVWQRPRKTPDYIPQSVSCTAPGYCSATGYYELGDVNTPDESAIGLIDEAAGTWGPWNLLQQTITWPYEAEAAIDPVSCGAPGNCALYGFFEDQYGAGDDFAVVKSLVPATATALTLTRARLVYGREEAGRFSVSVLASYGTPWGWVDVMSGLRTLCSVRLNAGADHCALAATQLPAGTYRPGAYYEITPGFATSNSGQVSLVVAKAATVTRVALTHPSVGYGEERSELIKVSVTPQYRGVPGSSVAVMTGTITLCTIRLSARKGSCSPAARALKPGRYRLTARYEGSGNFAPSRSAPSWLVISSG